ncbi:unnamed protein product [Arctogadus glacialis]
MYEELPLLLGSSRQAVRGSEQVGGSYRSRLGPSTHEPMCGPLRQVMDVGYRGATGKQGFLRSTKPGHRHGSAVEPRNAFRSSPALLTLREVECPGAETYRSCRSVTRAHVSNLASSDLVPSSVELRQVWSGQEQLVTRRASALETGRYAV